MRSKRDPEFAKNANQVSTRGIRLFTRHDRPKPFGVQWAERTWDESRQRDIRRVKTEFFSDVADRDLRAKKLREDRRTGALRSLSRREVEDWFAFRAAIGKTPWQDVVAAWKMQQLGTGHSDSPRTVAQHVKHFLKESAARVEEGGLAKAYHTHQKQKLGLFVGHFGDRALNRVTTEDVEAWLQSAGLATPGTYNNYRKIISTFLADAVHHNLIVRNPCDRIRRKHEAGDVVGILTVDQIARLFHTARTWRDGRDELRFACTLRRLALEAFAGVRYSSACRLSRDDVKMEDRGILHPARSIKTRKRQYIDGYPDVLWNWLELAPSDELLTERFYLRLKSQLFEVAGVPHPHNCLRHSFATYHLAARENPGKTALLLGHRNQGKLWDHYKGNATAAEGRRWEALTPARVQEMAAAAGWSSSPPAEAEPAPSRDRHGTLPAPADG